MPVTYYTAGEYREAVEKLQQQGLALAQMICNREGYTCIAPRAGSVNSWGSEGYCDTCPARKHCPYPKKQFSK